MKLDLFSRHSDIMSDKTDTVRLWGPSIALINPFATEKGQRVTPSRIIMPDGEWFTVRVTQFNHANRIDYVGAVFDKRRRFLRFKYVETFSEVQENRFEFGMNSKMEVTKLFYGDGELLAIKSPVLKQDFAEELRLYNEGELFDFVVAALMIADQVCQDYWITKEAA